MRLVCCGQTMEMEVGRAASRPAPVARVGRVASSPLSDPPHTKAESRAPRPARETRARPPTESAAWIRLSPPPRASLELTLGGGVTQRAEGGGNPSSENQADERGADPSGPGLM